MKAAWSMLAALVMVFALAINAQAEEKEVTLKGTITCAKCDLKKQNACATVITVKEGDKTVVYYFDKDGDKKHHKEICTEAKKGSVVGVVTKDGDKMVITVKDVKFE